VLAGTGMILMRYISAVWHYYLVWGVLIGMGLNIGLTVAIDKALTNWFIRKRGLAQGIRFSILGMFQIIALQIVTFLVTWQGWRVSSLICGLLFLAFIIPMFISVKQGRPEQYGMLPDGVCVDSFEARSTTDIFDLGVEYASGSGEQEFTFKQAIKTMSYWIIIVAMAMQSIIGGGFTLHIIPFLTDIGVEVTVASALMSMMIVFTIPSRLVGGIIADHLRKDRLYLLLVGTTSLHVIGIGTFLLFQNTASMYVLLICYGLSLGAGTPMVILILGRYYGRKAFGSILGITIALFAPMRLVSPVYCGWIYDTTGSYNTVFISFIIMAAMATIILLFLRPPEKPGQ
jgi:cyanate permease